MNNTHIYNEESSIIKIPNSMPTLKGYNYSDDEAHEARNKKRLLSMRLELSHICNLRCLYCNEGDIDYCSDNISFKTIKDSIRQVKDLGGRSIVVIGGGEPTIYPNFKELILYISNQNMTPVIFTNGIKINLIMAKFLSDNNVSIILKMDSQKEEIQDKLAGKKGAFKSIQNALDCLLYFKFNKRINNEVQLGLSFVPTILNFEEIPDIWRFCRENHIYPNYELLIPRGRAIKNNINLQLTKEQTISLKEELLRIDNTSYGYDWLPYKPLTAYGCLQMFYSIYLTTQGFVRPCADIAIKKFNINRYSIAQIIDTDFFNRIRNIEKYLKGKCKDCEYNDECIGCRGHSYTINIKRCKNPQESILSEDPLCWKPRV